MAVLVCGRSMSFCTCCPVAVSRHTAARPGSATLSKLRVHKFLDRDLCAATLQGYGLAWSGFREGYLLSGSDDAQICLWDINAANSKMLGAMAIYHQHLGVVEVTTRSSYSLPLLRRRLCVSWGSPKRQQGLSLHSTAASWHACPLHNFNSIQQAARQALSVQWCACAGCGVAQQARVHVWQRRRRQAAHRVGHPAARAQQ